MVRLRSMGPVAPGRTPAAQGPPGKTKDEPKPVASRQATALQLLSLLQRQGRLIDFLHEDLGQYDDAQIGAAVRSVHTGCKEALDAVVRLEPVLPEDEGASVNVPRGFDVRSIRLTGAIKGSPPFRGTLRHRGWRVRQLQPPPPAPTDSTAESILAPAEVEVPG